LLKDGKLRKTPCNIGKVSTKLSEAFKSAGMKIVDMNPGTAFVVKRPDDDNPVLYSAAHAFFRNEYGRLRTAYFSILYSSTWDGCLILRTNHEIIFDPLYDFNAPNNFADDFCVLRPYQFLPLTEHANAFYDLGSSGLPPVLSSVGFVPESQPYGPDDYIAGNFTVLETVLTVCKIQELVMCTGTSLDELPTTVNTYSNFGSKGMSGGPVFICQDNRIVIYGVVVGLIRSKPRKTVFRLFKQQDAEL
jgi:hypothetical protein